MADIGQARQFIMAIIDGIGWKNRVKRPALHLQLVEKAAGSMGYAPSPPLTGSVSTAREDSSAVDIPGRLPAGRPPARVASPVAIPALKPLA